MNASLSKVPRPILVRPAGIAQIDRADEFYVIDRHSGAMTPISGSLVPQTQLVSDGGGTYTFRKQNGWIVDVTHMSGSKESWVAQSIGDDIEVETPSLKFRVLEDGVNIQLRVIGPVGHYVVKSAR